MPTGIYIRTTYHRKICANNSSFKNGNKHPRFGKPCPEKQKDAISKANKGRPAWNKGNRKRLESQCYQCNKIIYDKHKRKFCSHKCYWRSIKNKIAIVMTSEVRRKIGIGNWKGGKYKNSLGYICIGEHNSRKRVYEHRLIVEKYLRRCLTLKEVVHHIGEKDDNRPHMLMAFVNNMAHIRFHRNPNSVKPEDIIFDGRKLSH